MERDRKKGEKQLKKTKGTGRGGQKRHGRGSGRGRGRGQQGQKTRNEQGIPGASESSTSSAELEHDYTCDVCGMCGGGDRMACDTCDIWYHQECIGVSGENLEEFEWLCTN